MISTDPVDGYLPVIASDGRAGLMWIEHPRIRQLPFPPQLPPTAGGIFFAWQFAQTACCASLQLVNKTREAPS